MTQPRYEAAALKSIGTKPMSLSEFEHSVGALVFHGTRFVSGLTAIVPVVRAHAGSLPSEFIPSVAWIYVSEESGPFLLWQLLCEAVAMATETEAFRPYVHAPELAGMRLGAIDEALAQHDEECMAKTLQEGETDADE